MLKATLRSFLAHKGRLLLSALAVVLSVAFVAGSLIFSDTVTRTFDRLFASTSADVTVSPKEDSPQRDVPTGAVETVPGPLAGRSGRSTASPPPGSTRPSRTSPSSTSENESVGPTSGAPTIATNWYVTDRSPVKLTSGHAPRGAGEALLDADTADKKHVRIGDTLTVLAQPGSFKVRIVGIATFTHHQPRCRAGLPGHRDGARRSCSAGPDARHEHLRGRGARGERRRAEAARSPPNWLRSRYDLKTADEQADVGRRRTRRIPRRDQVRDARLRRDRRAGRRSS